MNIKILYEDNHVIAAAKPAGMLAQGDKTGDVSLFDLVKDYIKEKKNKKTPSNPSGQAGNVFLGLVHRLDRPACGIVLFAKTSKGASRLSEQFREGKIDKTYHVLVEGRPEENRGVILTCLEKDEKNKKAVVVKGGKNAKPVKLIYEVIKSNDKFSLLKIKIETGKFHQIRAQLASIGHPVVGDLKYGATFPMPDKSIALCANSITFKLATKDEIKTISIRIPTSWNNHLKI